MTSYASARAEDQVRQRTAARQSRRIGRLEARAHRSTPLPRDLSCQREAIASSSGCCDKFASPAMRRGTPAAVVTASDSTLCSCSRSCSAAGLPGHARGRCPARPGPRLRQGNEARMPRALQSAALIFTLAIALSGDLASFGLRSVHCKTIKPAWQWDGQRLFSCAVPKADAETQCQCYTYDPNAVVKCMENEPEEPEFETLPGKYGAEFSRWKSCTHDPKVQYGCKDPNDKVLAVG